MFRLVLFFCTISFACSCNSSGNDAGSGGPDPKPDSNEFLIPQNRQQLLARFQQTDTDSLHVVPFIEKRKEKINGVELDSMEKKFFPALAPYGAAEYTPTYFAARKMDINDRFIGLLTRTMSFYAPTSMKLYIYDKKRDSITGYTELADQFGDGGAYGEKEAWLFKEAGKLTAILSEFNAVDHTLDVPAGTGIDSTFSYFKIQFDNGRADTLSTDNVELKKAYPHLLEY